MISPLQLSYLAGFYEGEGGCYVYPRVNHVNGKIYRYKYGVLKVAISQKYKPIITWIRKTVGFGSVLLRAAGGRYGNCAIWYWQCSSRQGTQFIRTILPYMRCPHKIKQGEL